MYTNWQVDKLTADNFDARLKHADWASKKYFFKKRQGLMKKYKILITILLQLKQEMY